jgi:hypothetical protein
MLLLALRLLKILAGMVLGLGLAAGLLCAGTIAAPEYLPIARAVMGLGGLGLGYLLGQAVRPLGRWRPPVPLSPETAAPQVESIGRVWLRGFAAGFWALAALGITSSLLSCPLIMSIGLSPAIPLLILALGVVALVPMTVARAMVAGGAGLPRWTLVTAAIAGCSGGIGLLLATGALAALLGPLPAGAVGDAVTLPTLAVVPVIAVGTPVLAHDLRPSVREPAWSGLLALLALGGAWLLAMSLSPGTCINSLGPMDQWLWLLPASVLWGSSFGAVLAVAIARQRAERLHADGAAPRRVSRLTLAAGALGLFLFGLVPLAVWLLMIAMPGLLGMYASPLPPPVPPSGLPNATQPGALPIPGPALLSPAAGATVAGSPWTFIWNPARGSTPGEMYQFALWTPGVARPVTQATLTGMRLRVSAMRQSGRSPQRPWTWRVRVVRPGQGAGQWSEAWPFTPVWGAVPGSGPALKPPGDTGKSRQSRLQPPPALHTARRRLFQKRHHGRRCDACSTS